jgi:hypothetical protein
MLATADLIRPATYNRGLYVVTKPKWQDLQRELHKFSPKTELGEVIKRAFKYLPPDLAWEMLDTVNRCVIMQSSLAVVVTRPPHSLYNETDRIRVEDYGIVSRHKVTTEGVTALCVAWGAATFAMLYMGLATLNTAEANTDTCANRFDTGNEIAANHYAGGVRPTCTHVHSANTVPLVGLHTQTTGGDSVESHGILDSATRISGLLWDRSLTGTQVLAVADSLTATYTVTCSAEA